MNKLAPYFLLIFLVSSVAAQEFSITPLKEQYLRDDVGLLDRTQRETIIGLLEKQSQKSLGRIYLDIIDRLPAGQTIEQYARKRLNEQSRMPGEKADKIMVAISLKDRTVRIETSRDVWTILSDDYCRQINREVMIPKFKSEAYFAGIKAGIEAIIRKLNNP